MGLNVNQLIIIKILVLIIWIPVALADPSEDFVRGQASLDKDEWDNAAKYLRKAAEQNYIPAQTALGQLYHASQDNEVAVGWFLTAAYQGDAAGAYELGQMYANGEGVEKDFNKAVYWISYAAKKNYVRAVEVLANSYQNGGLGLAVDLSQAKIWQSRLPALRAAEKKMLDQKLEELKTERKEIAKAAKEKAAAQKEIAKKSEDDAAAKRVDDEDEVKKASEKNGPVQ